MVTTRTSTTAAADYQDNYLTLQDGVLSIRWYYFPIGVSKRIRVSDIRRATRHPMRGPCTGKGRLWGGMFLHWLHLDWQRHKKHCLFVLDVGNTCVCPTVTPSHPQAFAEALRALHVEVDESNSGLWW